MTQIPLMAKTNPVIVAITPNAIEICPDTYEKKRSARDRLDSTNATIPAQFLLKE